MIILRYITITLNIIFALIILCFAHPLRWENEEERSSLIGFGFMFALYMLNIGLIALL